MTQTDLRAAARAWADRGFIPMAAADKAPVAKGWQSLAPKKHAHRIDLRDPQQIGLRMGLQPDGRRLLCIDVDLPDGDAQLRDLENQLGELPRTLEQATGGGGQHLVYVWPADLGEAPRHRLAGKIDLRGERQHIVAAPSPHPSGNRYRLVDDIDPVELPRAWALHIVSLKAPKPAAPVTPSRGSDRRLERCRAAIERSVARFGVAVQGSRGSDRLYEVATHCNRLDLPDAEALALLREYSASCDPPWTDREIEHKLRDARERHPEERGAWLRDNGRRHVAEPRSEAREPPRRTGLVPSKDRSGRRLLPDGSPDTLAKLIAPELKRERLVGATDRLFGLRGVLWSEVPSAPELYEAIEPLSGALYMRPTFDRGRVELAPTGLVQLSSKLVKDIGDSLKMQNHDEAFFDSAPVGVSFSDSFVGPGRVEPLSGAHRQRQRLPWQFNADVSLERDAPMFHCALSEWFEGDPDAREKAVCLGEFAGLALIGGFGPATKGRSNIQTAVMNLGEGANGKSVFLELLSSMLPPEYVSNVAPQDMGNEYYRDMLAGKRANICPEIPEREVIAAGNLKAVISCDPGMTARAPYGKPYSFQPMAGHIYSANNLPRFSDTSGGFMRRWIVVQWNNVVPEHRRDPSLCRKLLENEGGAIASWFVLRGIEAFARGRLTVPKSSESAKATWAGDSDQVLEYREERLVRMPDGARQSDWAPVGDLYRDYCVWAQSAGHRFPLGRRQFAKRLERVAGAAQVKRDGCARIPLRLRAHEGESEEW